MFVYVCLKTQKTHTLQLETYCRDTTSPVLGGACRFATLHAEFTSIEWERSLFAKQEYQKCNRPYTGTQNAERCRSADQIVIGQF